MATSITTTIDIGADPQAVWDVLTDFAAYPEWNPFLDRIDGRPVVGTGLVVHLVPPGGRAMTFKPTVLTVTPGRELRWLGRLLIPGLFDGEHRFVLAPNGAGGTRLTQAEHFSGILVRVFKGTLKNTHAGFEAANEALKRRVESADRSR